MRAIWKGAHMLSSPIERLRFFLYSVAILIAELFAVALCVAATMGFDGFVRSKPGPSREGLALASLVVMLVFAAARMNIAWRRGRDAELSKWLVVPYMVFVALFAVLQAATLLTYDFGTGNTNIGLNILSIALFAVWCRLCLASSRGRPFDPDTLLTAEGFGGSPSGTVRLTTTASVAAAASMRSTPASISTPGYGNAGGIAFGKRGRD
jgi:uncharacterized membrane protein YhaH (DUF805 family)